MAVLFYVIAGVLIALPDSSWETVRLGKGIVRGMGVFFIGMGVLQAWPGRGSWSGQAHGAATTGTLTAMAQQMAQVSQPSVTASWVRSFASFQAGHGWLVNLVVVVALLGVGSCLLSGKPGVVRVGVIVGSVFCLATWVLVQDFGFFGGVGTDPNSMIPMALVFGGGYLAMVRLPVRARADGTPGVVAAESAVSGRPEPSTPAPAGWLDRLQPNFLLRSLLALGAVGILLVGAAPMAVAAASPHADPILIEAANGSPDMVNVPAFPFTLTDTDGRTVSLASLAGHTVVLTFLDPVCTSDCPLIAQDLKLARPGPRVPVQRGRAGGGGQ